MKSRQAYIRCISAVICLLVALANSEAVVLCMGEDGHVAIETVGSSCCESAQIGTSEGHSAVFVDDSQYAGDDCGSCVDIPLSGGYAGSLNTAKKANLSFAASSPAAPLPASPQVSERQLAGKSLELTPFFTPLRSVILLI
jgi:hypothetical protein